MIIYLVRLSFLMKKRKKYATISSYAIFKKFRLHKWNIRSIII